MDEFFSAQMVYACAITWLVVYICTPVFRRLAVKKKIVDLPNRRKVHKKATPLLGGAAIGLGVAVGVLFKQDCLPVVGPLVLASLAILLINLMDDIRGLSAMHRFVMETVVALALVSTGVRISFLPPGFFGAMGEIVVTILWFVGVTNAFNYLDGLDGLATGSAGINFFFFSLILFSSGQPELGFLSLILMVCCLGFLPHNFRKATIFLGDAGSTFLGFMLAGLAVSGEWASNNIVRICIPLLILGVPIFDMIFTTILRIKEKKVRNLIEWLQYGGKDHFHHYLVELGLQKNGAVFFIWSVTFSLGISSVMLGNDNAWEAYLTLVQASIVFGMIGVLIVVGKRRQKKIEKLLKGQKAGG